jgi:hypothetical protein
MPSRNITYERLTAKVKDLDEKEKVINKDRIFGLQTFFLETVCSGKTQKTPF